MKNQQPFGNTDPTYKASGTYREPKKLNVTSIPHAILTTDGRVIAIRNYPKVTNSNAVVKIAEGARCKVGWRHAGKGHFEP